ncbi:hypothetical protein [Lactiplantibacillus plantarum]|uniref:hypothetical protein n=1 Tax=Lactiplantibacillus plantarum TaxID=1590 RepID=UPI003F52FB0E
MAAITDKLGVNEWGMYFNGGDYETFKDNIDYDFEMMNQLPINWVRLGTTYSDSLVTDEGFDWSRLDYAVAKANMIGLKVIIPVWFGTGNLTNKTNVDYQQALINWRKLITSLVHHYKGQGITYEAIDEANGGGPYWLDRDAKSNMADIISMNNFFARLVATDDTASYITGDFSWPGDPSYIDTAITAIKRGMLSVGQAVSYHPYHRGIPEQILTNEGELNLRQQFANHNLPVAATEYGYPVLKRFNGVYTAQQQSDYILRQTLLMDMLGFDKMIAFTMDNSDKGWALQHNYYDGSNKGSFNQVGSDYQQLFTELLGYTFSTRVTTDSQDDYLLTYTAPDKSTKLVYWTAAANHAITVSGIAYQLTGTPTITTMEQLPSQNQLTTIQLISGIDVDWPNYWQQVCQVNANSITVTLNMISNTMLNRFGIQSPTFTAYAKPLPLDDSQTYFWQKDMFMTIMGQINQLIAFFNRYNWLIQDDGSYWPSIYIDGLTGLTLSVVQKQQLSQDWATMTVAINNLINKINQVTQ